MSILTRSPPPIPITYGDKICSLCSLTLAEYLNGQLYPSPLGGWGYFHHACMDQLNHQNSNRSASTIIP